MLYAGGVFETAGLLTTTNIAAWDGNNWSLVGGAKGPDNRVISMASYQGDLYIGGDFTTVGIVPANQIARWDGTDWFEVGGGVSSQFWPSVMAMTVFEDRLVVGGWFTHAGGKEVSYIAAWDGAAWHQFDLGFPNFVWSLSVHNETLYAGGDFSSIGYLARWDGFTWKSQGGHFNSPVRALESYSNHLYAAGLFTLAGTSSSFYIARWDDYTQDVADDLSNNTALSFSSPGIVYPSSPADFSFALDFAAKVTIDLFDLQGRRMANLIDRTLPPGQHSVSWAGASGQGATLSPGIYYAKLSAGPHTARQKVILIY